MHARTRAHTHARTRARGYTSHDNIQVKIFWHDWLLPPKKQQGQYKDKPSIPANQHHVDGEFPRC